MDSPRPHDLLWLHADTVPHGCGSEPVLPDWVNQRWPVVVRRADAPGYIPVGLRGVTRSQRLAAVIAPEAMRCRVTPEQLQQQQSWLRWPQLAGFAALDCLIRLNGLINDLGLAWGPTGGVGFALATGVPVLRADSDLDLLIRASQPLSAAQIALLRQIQQGGLASTSCRIDIQIDTGRGGFAFSEFARSTGKVLLKTNSGALLSADPWS